MDLIVTFQITPYSDTIASYINSLSPTEIYSIFNTPNVTPDILTAALIAIYKLRNSLGLQDELLFTENLNDLTLFPHVFVVIQNNTYVHHVYAWSVENPNGQGSVTNIVGNVSGLPILINAIRKWSLQHNIDIIRVLQPSSSTIPMLRRSGFVFAKIMRNEESFRWLFDNSSIGDTSLANGLLFREYDYISNTIQ